MFALPQPAHLSYPTKDTLPTHPKHPHLQKQILSNSPSSNHLAVYPPILHLPLLLPRSPLPHLVLVLVSSTYSAVLLAYVVESSSHLVVAPLHFL